VSISSNFLFVAVMYESVDAGTYYLFQVYLWDYYLAEYEYTIQLYGISLNIQFAHYQESVMNHCHDSPVSFRVRVTLMAELFQIQ